MSFKYLGKKPPSVLIYFLGNSNGIPDSWKNLELVPKDRENHFRGALQEAAVELERIWKENKPFAARERLLLTKWLRVSAGMEE